MLIIEKNSTNTIVATLTEKVTIVNPYYLFVCYGKSNQAVVKCLLTDVSEYTYRYNKFTFSEGTDITFPNKGDYTYKFYQKDAADTTIPSETYLLETGILRVVNEGQTITSHSVTRTTKVHEL